MATMALENQRVDFVKTFLNETNENLLSKVIIYYEQLKAGMTIEPCRMTISELRNEVMASVEDARKNLGVSVETARAKHPRV